MTLKETLRDIGVQIDDSVKNMFDFIIKQVEGIECLAAGKIEETPLCVLAGPKQDVRKYIFAIILDIPAILRKILHESGAAPDDALVSRMSEMIVGQGAPPTLDSAILPYPLKDGYGLLVAHCGYYKEEAHCTVVVEYVFKQLYTVLGSALIKQIRKLVVAPTNETGGEQ